MKKNKNQFLFYFYPYLSKQDVRSFKNRTILKARRLLAASVGIKIQTFASRTAASPSVNRVNRV